MRRTISYTFLQALVWMAVMALLGCASPLAEPAQEVVISQSPVVASTQVASATLNPTPQSTPTTLLATLTPTLVVQPTNEPVAKQGPRPELIFLLSDT